VLERLEMALREGSGELDDVLESQAIPKLAATELEARVLLSHLSELELESRWPVPPVSETEDAEATVPIASSGSVKSTSDVVLDEE